MATACSICGTVSDDEDGGGPLGWSPSFTERGVVWQCPTCVREHVRDIETKLPDEYWE